MEGALLLDVVVREGAAVLELLAGEDQPLLVRGDSLLVLDLLLDVIWEFLVRNVPIPHAKEHSYSHQLCRRAQRPT